MSLVVVARWRAREDTQEQVAGILRELAAASRAEPGCLLYRPVRSVDDPREFTLVEEYAGEEALAEHRASEHFRTLVLGQVVGLLETRQVGRFTDVAAGGPR
ncbi:putative quinol monooxygenase [Streptomyces marincola]|uniref:ABM domain-containing protein n=1 Tax=Streptomyces marincola TaxID=2878388 RepID=A0A1W7CS22_9ACTN|nr:putative quinol monooxygenase [Streptomyces marincola]ARQ67547.1 hypothetical protein CAG99_00740 [Streptomyces marincola]